MISLGWHVIGFLPGYAGEEGFDATGAGFYLLGLDPAGAVLGGLPTRGFTCVAAAAILAALAAAVLLVRDTASGPARAAAMAVAFVVLLSPHYAWYFAWLIVFACFVSPAALLWLTNACLLLYLMPVDSHIVRNPYRLRSS